MHNESESENIPNPENIIDLLVDTRSIPKAPIGIELKAPAIESIRMDAFEMERVYTNRALLGEIRPHMRKISIEYIKEKQTVVLYFYFDRDLTQEELDYDIPGTIVAEVCSDFPQRLLWEEEVIIIPYPQIIHEKGICVYSRYEASPTPN